MHALIDEQILQLHDVQITASNCDGLLSSLLFLLSLFSFCLKSNVQTTPCYFKINPMYPSTMNNGKQHIRLSNITATGNKWIQVFYMSTI